MPEEPRARLMVLGESVRLKSGGGTMTRTVMEWLRFELEAETERV